MDDKITDILDAVVAVALIVSIVYLADQHIITGQYALVGLIGIGTGFGVWRLRGRGEQ
jgi:hypothetical protein